MIDYIFARDMGAFYTLSFKEQFRMVWDVSLKRVYEGYTSGEVKPVSIGLYGAHNIDGYGDQVGNTLKNKSKAIAAELDALVANKYGADFDEESLGFEYIEKFVSWCKDRKIKCVFMPSTLMYFDVYKSDEKERYFYENLAKVMRKKGFEFVGEPYKYMYDKKFYFNTDFHLVDSARDVRTRGMIGDLK